MKKIISAVVSLSVLALLLSSCGGAGGTSSASGNKITASGSSALLPFAQFLATQYKTKNPNVTITVNGGGSGTGLSQVLQGAVDIGNSDLFAQEKLQPSDAQQLVDHQVCVIGVGIIVSTDVTATNLTKTQLKSIFDGTATNWKDVGGSDEAITIVNRPPSSGTRALFVKWGLDSGNIVEGDSSLQSDDSNQLTQMVSTTKGAISYVGFSYTVNPAGKFNVLKLDGVEATNDNIYNNTYPIWGYEHMYTKGQPNATVKAFLDFATDPSVEPQYEAMGYGAISKLSQEAAAAKQL